MSWYQVASPAVASKEEHSCNHQNAPQEGANAANQHWVLKHGQDLRQIPSSALRLRRNGHLWVWKADINQMKSYSYVVSWMSTIFVALPFNAQHGTRLPIFITLLTHTMSSLLVRSTNHCFFFPFLTLCFNIGLVLWYELAMDFHRNIWYLEMFALSALNKSTVENDSPATHFPTQHGNFCISDSCKSYNKK